MSPQKLEFFALKKSMTANFGYGAKPNTGKGGIDNESEKISFRHRVVNMKRLREMDHNCTMNVYKLQRSQYI